jgi:hypothetical protein
MRRLMLGLATTAAAAAQTPACLSFNDTNNTVNGALTNSTATAPNVHAFRIAPPGGLVLQAIQIFTGNTTFAPGFMKLELWHNDPSTNLPWVRRAGGTWQIDPSLGNAWQGANLDLDIVPFLGEQDWVVWTEPGSSTEPYEPGGATLPTATLAGGTWTLQPSVALKCRLFCTWLDGAHVTTSVFPRCPTFPGYWGTLFTNQQPAVGNASFAVEATGFPPAQTALLALGLNPNGSVSLPGLLCPLQTDAVATSLGATGTGDVRASATGPGASGHAAFPLPIPANPGLAGLYVGAQVGVLDPAFAAPLPFVTSNALRIVVF